MLLEHELAETDQQAFERFDIYPFAAAYTFKRAVDASLFHESTCKRRIERRQSEGSVMKHLNKLSSHPKQEHRTELGIHARAENQLIPAGLNHRLYGHSVKVLWA